VSIVSPCFNQERFVAQMVTSVQTQTEQRWQLIVVDDGSSDGSLEAVRAASAADDRVSVIQRPHRGVSSARMAGVAVASPSSSYLLFLDADDELEPTMLDRFTRELESDPTLSMAHSRVTFIDESSRVLPGTPGMLPRLVRDRWGVRELADTETVTPFASILALAGLIPSCVMIRRSAFDTVGGWDEGFGQGFEDTDLFLRLALHGPVRQIPDRLVRHRRHSAQSSEQPGRHEAQIVKLHMRWRDLHRVAAGHQAVVRDAWKFYDRQLNWRTAYCAARRLLGEGRPLAAARFVGGSVIVTVRSFATHWHVR
jgi:GT2 family glycosyltransferase